MRYLRTNTAARVTVGPFFDKTDGVTPEVALTVTSCKLTLMVDVANVPTLILDTAPTASGGANDMVHVTNDDAGFYDLELAAADVNYLGRAMLAVTDAATHCPVFHEFMILPANVYDAMILGTATLSADATKIGGTTQTGRDIGASVLLSSGTGTGQLDITSGVVKGNLVQVNAAAQTATLDTIKAETVSILADTGELQTDWANGGRLDLLLDKATEGQDAHTDTTEILTRLPDATAGATGGLAIVGSIMGKSPATLAAADVSGNLPVDLKAITTGVDFNAAMKTSLNAATPASVQNIAAQTGDAYARLGAPAGASVSADIAAVPTAVLAATYEGTETVAQGMRIMRSALAGKSSGGGTTTLVLRDAADTKVRITATVDADGNRTAVTTDGA